MFEYNPDLMASLVEAGFQPQEAIGEVPMVWAQSMHLDHPYELPNRLLNRTEVRAICRSEKHDVLYGYLCAMAWGGQGIRFARHAQTAWANRHEIESKLKKMKTEKMCLQEAYDLFCGQGKIPGLGPAYFTKLLYFFCPEPVNMYILDQWTTKSVLLLTGAHIIRHTNLGPTRWNTGENYELFCRVIEHLITPLNANSGEEVEQRIFSVGGARKQPRGPFRQVVFDRWPNRPPMGRYDHNLVVQFLN